MDFGLFVKIKPSNVFIIYNRDFKFQIKMIIYSIQFKIIIKQLVSISIKNNSIFLLKWKFMIAKEIKINYKYFYMKFHTIYIIKFANLIFRIQPL